MQILELNADVLDAILYWVDKASLVNFMSASRSAYDAGFPHLVSTVDLHHSMRQVFDFCHFMLLDKHSHVTLPMLRSLRLYGAASAIAINEKKPEVVLGLDAFGRVLEQARNLMTLRVVDISYLFALDTRIRNAIAHHPGLTAIFFTATDTFSYDVISKMHELRHIHVAHGSDLIPVIRPFQATLETLSSEYRFFRNPNDLLSLTDTDVWPRLHTLNLGLLTVKTHRLVRAFPNLRRLRLQAVVRSRLVETPTYECWPSLDYVEVTIAGLHELALTCPVRELHLTIPVDMKFWQNDNWLSALLEPLRIAAPSALSFPVITNMRDEPLFSQLATLIPNLKVLGLSFVYDPVITLHRLSLVLKLLENVPLGYLTLELSRPTPIMHSPAEILMFLGPTFSIPTVQVIELQLHGSPRNPVFGIKTRGKCSWWRVIHGSVGGPQFEKISADLGLRFRELYVMGKMGL